MTSKADFNADEWSTVVEAPVLAGMRVVAAGRGGTIRESLAMAKVYTEARRQQGESELLDALASSPPAVDTQQARAGGDLAAVSTERLREALRLVREKGSQADDEEYRRFVLAVAQAAAEAHKEGGFIGIGGKTISDEEQAALDQIRSTLEAVPMTRD
jgi:hypothetical protein